MSADKFNLPTHVSLKPKTGGRQLSVRGGIAY